MITSVCLYVFLKYEFIALKPFKQWLVELKNKPKYLESKKFLTTVRSFVFFKKDAKLVILSFPKELDEIIRKIKEIK